MRMNELATLVERTINSKIRNRAEPSVYCLGGKLLPGFVELLLKPASGTRINQVKNLSDDIALAVGSPHVRVAQSGVHIAVQIAVRSREVVRLSSLMNGPKLPPYTATIGIENSGSPVHMLLSSPDVSHFLIAGTTGSGKTVMMNTIVTSLASRMSPNELGVVYIDPKRRVDDRLVKGLRNHLLAPPISEVPEAVKVLQRVVSVMEQRKVGAGQDYPRVLVVVDELADVLMVGGKTLETLITRIAQRGREPGFHLLVSTQKPTAKVIGSLLKANLPARICGRVMSATDSYAATGMPDLDANRLAGRGQFVMACAGEVLRVQGAVCDVQIPDWRQQPHAETQSMLFRLPAPVSTATSNAQEKPGWKSGLQLQHRPAWLSEGYRMPTELQPKVDLQIGDPPPESVDAVTPDVDDEQALVLKCAEYLRAHGKDVTRYAICKNVMGVNPSGQWRLTKAERLREQALALIESSEG